MAHINSWEIKKFIRIVLAIQLAMLGLVGLAVLGYDVPLLRQFIGFIYLAFIPGLLLLRILKLHRLGPIETLLYSVGLSIAFVMFLGFFMNLLYPIIGISKPISILPLIATITFVVLILCVIAYKRGSSEKESLPQNSPIQWSQLLSSPVLFLLLLPVVSALGAFLVYLHYGNVPLLILLSLIALTAVLVAFGKFIPTKLYPLAILAISISLLWHSSLISPGLTGHDIQHEYYFQNLVLTNSLWDHTFPGNLNAMLSLVMVAPIYSLILNMDTVWIFKIIYPLFFSLVPPALFQAFRKQTGDKIAFLAAFFFMSVPPFFSGMIQMARQQIGELFLALSILLFLSKEVAATKRATLLIIFGFSIVVSHYGISYLYMGYLLIGLPLLLLWRGGAKELWERIAARFSKFRHSVGIAPQSPRLVSESLPRSTLTGSYVMLFVVFCLAWYMYVSSASVFNTVVGMGNHIYHSLITEFFVVEARDLAVLQAFGVAPLLGVGWEREVARVIQYVTQLFIVVGVFGLIANWRKTRFHPEYTAMTLVSALLLLICILVPYFASHLGTTRIYRITLFFLVPFCVLGGITIFRWLFSLLRIHQLRNKLAPASLNMVATLVLVPYFLFMTGFVVELTGATPMSMPLALYKADWTFFASPDARARQWLESTALPGSMIYGDWNTSKVLSGSRDFRPSQLPLEIEQTHQDSYIFLRHWNIEHNQISLFSRHRVLPVFKHVDLQDKVISSILESRNKIYDSGAEILGPGSKRE